MGFARILIIDPDVAMVSAIAAMLSTIPGRRIYEAIRLSQARELWQRHLPEIVIIDPTLPDGDGLQLCQQAGEKTWVITTSTSRNVDDEERFLAIGDMYLQKPFLPGQLFARLNALARRQKGKSATTLRVPTGERDLRVETLYISAKHDVEIAGRCTHLTALEYRLLTALAANPGQICPARFLVEMMWRDNDEEWSRASQTECYRRLASHLCNLRIKIAPAIIEAVRGEGLQLVTIETTQPARKENT